MQKTNKCFSHQRCSFLTNKYKIQVKYRLHRQQRRQKDIKKEASDVLRKSSRVEDDPKRMHTVTLREPGRKGTTGAKYAAVSRVPSGEI